MKWTLPDPRILVWIWLSAVLLDTCVAVLFYRDDRPILAGIFMFLAGMSLSSTIDTWRASRS